MSKKIAKKIVALAMIVSCLAGMAYSTNAYSYTISFGPSTSLGFSSSKKYFGDHAYSSVVTYASFNGMPAGSIPYNKYICVRLYKQQQSGTTNSPACLHYTLNQAIVFDPYTAGYHYVGAYTNASAGATVWVTVS